MIRSFFKIAIRNFQRQFTYSVINVLGLAIGIASSLVILVFAYKELNYERHFEDHQRVYRIGTKFMTMGEFANGPQILFEVLPATYPWVENTCRIKPADKASLKVGNYATVSPGLFVEPSFFDLFPYPFELGDGDLTRNGIVLNTTLVKQLFPMGNPIGKIVVINTDGKEQLYTVNGVVNTNKYYSHLNAPFWAVIPEGSFTDPNWFMVDVYNYVKVKSNTGVSEIESGIRNIIKSNLFPSMGSSLSFEEWYSRDDAFRLIVQPLDDIYLSGALRFDLTEGGNATLVYILIVIAVLILVIASVNFINLSTARAIIRSKEVGLKKVIGSSRAQLALQFLSESVMISLVAMILALGLSELILIGVENITGLSILDSVFSKPIHLLGAFLLSLTLGVISGMYPAFFLSSFKPVDVLKSTFKGSSKHII